LGSCLPFQKDETSILPVFLPASVMPDGINVLLAFQATTA
jgi:hypothetical protein